MSKLLEFLNHECYQAISVAAVVCFFFWIYGCKSTTISPSDPTTKITRSQLTAEIDYYLAKAEIAYADLDKQDEIKQKLLNAATLAAQGGQVNILGLILTNIGILGAGATIDNIRKRKIIKNTLTYEKPNVGEGT